jgi:hypothetical protein
MGSGDGMERTRVMLSFGAFLGRQVGVHCSALENLRPTPQQPLLLRLHGCEQRMEAIEKQALSVCCS